MHFDCLVGAVREAMKGPVAGKPFQMDADALKLWAPSESLVGLKSTLSRPDSHLVLDHRLQAIAPQRLRHRRRSTLGGDSHQASITHRRATAILSNYRVPMCLDTAVGTTCPVSNDLVCE